MESSLFCYSACLILIVTGLICSVIRWCHMCHPYNQKADYFYPSLHHKNHLMALLKRSEEDFFQL